MTPSDLELLQTYSQTGSETAFAELVNRHLPLVFSAAMRQVRSADLAQDVAQSVFTDLAKSAARLREGALVSAWLYQVTRRTAVDCIRRETRRQSREQTAFEMSQLHTNDGAWSQIEPLLDEGMESLDEQDRGAILLRYFENKNFQEVGSALGISDDAAQKRVSRAVERLRSYFTKRGVGVSASSVVLAISANAAPAVPSGLATVVTTSVLSSAALGTISTVATKKVLAATAVQKTIVATAVALAIGTGFYQTARSSQLQDELQLRQKQSRAFAAEQAALETNLAEGTRALSLASQELEQLRLQQIEFGTLHAEQDRLRAELADAKGGDQSVETDSRRLAAIAWIMRTKQLVQWMESHPEERIPELELIEESEWMDAAHDLLEEEDDFLAAAEMLRYSGRQAFAYALPDALNKYIKAHDEQLPLHLSELKPYADCSCITDEMLERYKLLRTGKAPGYGSKVGLVTEKAPIKGYSDRITISRQGWSSAPEAKVKQSSR
ncbi:MAG: sigma-70 family RNA polymerase sigma factor [Verrucomicrobia bacterium]|nr:sigma-70 family RNA polymerase sigma factor [Verrucomicrobiota bacterium]